MSSAANFHTDRTVLFQPNVQDADGDGVYFRWAVDSAPTWQWRLRQALSLMGSGASFAPRSSVASVKTPIDPFSAAHAARVRGLAVSYISHPFDTVSAIGSPWLLPTAVISLPVYVATGARAYTVDVWNRSVRQPIFGFTLRRWSGTLDWREPQIQNRYRRRSRRV